MVRRFWLGTLADAYVTHGETYLDPTQSMDESSTPTNLVGAWGNAEKGTSPQRIAFLRKLVEETTAGGKSLRTGLEATPAAYYLNAVSYAQSGDGAGTNSQPVQQIIFYTDFHQPVYYAFPLPEGSYSAELIDPWEMTVKALPGKFAGKVQIRLNDKPYQAVRFRRFGLVRALRAKRLRPQFSLLLRRG